MPILKAVTSTKVLDNWESLTVAQRRNIAITLERHWKEGFRLRPETEHCRATGCQVEEHEHLLGEVVLNPELKNFFEQHSAKTLDKELAEKRIARPRVTEPNPLPRGGTGKPAGQQGGQEVVLLDTEEPDGEKGQNEQDVGDAGNVGVEEAGSSVSSPAAAALLDLDHVASGPTVEEAEGNFSPKIEFLNSCGLSPHLAKRPSEKSLQGNSKKQKIGSQFKALPHNSGAAIRTRSTRQRLITGQGEAPAK